MQKVIDKIIEDFKLKRNLCQYLFLLLYKFGFDLVYALVIGKYFEYGDYFNHFKIQRFLITFLIFVVFSPHIIGLLKKRSSFSILLFALEIGYFIPLLSLYTFNDIADIFLLYAFLYWSMCIIVYNFLKNFKIKTIKFKYLPILWLISIFFLLYASYICLKYRNFELIFSFKDVYKLRNIQVNTNIPIISNYFLSMAGTILPIILLDFLNKKNWIGTIATIVVQIAVFSFGGMKKYLLYLFLSFAAYFFFKRKKNILVALPGLCVLHIFAILEYCLKKGMPQIANYVHRRTMLLPVTLSAHYFDFFSTHPYDYLMQGVLRRFGFKSIYKVPIQNIIGGLYLGNYDCVASNGLCGNAFGNFGWFSLVLYPPIIIFTLYIVGLILDKKNNSFTLIVAIIIFTLFTNGDYFTNLLSNGLMAMIIILTLIPNKKNEET